VVPNWVRGEGRKEAGKEEGKGKTGNEGLKWEPIVPETPLIERENCERIGHGASPRLHNGAYNIHVVYTQR